MFNWLFENMATIIVAVIVFGVFLAIIISQVKRRKKGKGSCAHGCDSCPSSNICHRK